MDRDRRHTHSVTLPGEQIVTYTPQESAYLESNIGISSSSQNNNNNISKHVSQPQPMFPLGYIQPQQIISLQGSHGTSHSLPKYLQEGAMSLPEIQHMAMMAGGHSSTTPRRVARTRQERCVEVGRLMSPGGHSLSGMTQVPGATWATNTKYLPTNRHRERICKERRESGGVCGGWWRCWMTLMCLAAQILLHGLLGVLLYWILKYRSEDLLIPFVWIGASDNIRLIENLHSLLMISGTVYCTGQAILVYVFYNCCQPGCSRLLHLMFHLLSISCITIGMMSAWDMDTITSSHMVTMHAWCGAATVALIAVQIVFGLMSLAVLQCYKSENEKYKATILPLHRAIGITIFLLSIASAITGITQTERRSEGNVVVASNSTSMYEALLLNGLQEEGLILNILGLIMIILAIIIPIVVSCNQNKRK